MIDYAIRPAGNRFAAALEQVRKVHAFAEEIVKMDLSDEVDSFMQLVDGMDKDSLLQNAGSIRNTSLELIFHALIQDIDSKQKNKLILLLSSRMKKRFFNYCWILLQGHYTNVNLIEAFTLLMEYMDTNYHEEYARSLAGCIEKFDGNVIENALDLFMKEQLPLDVLFKKYRVISESPFAIDIIRLYFTRCDRDGFQVNEKFFAGLIMDDDEIYPMVNHYLESVEVLEYIDSINNIIMERFGLPGKEQHVFWDGIEKANQGRYHQWAKLKALQAYMGNRTEKYDLWKDYYHSIRKVEYIQELGMIVIHLPKYVVVDLEKDRAVSYLYKQNVFSYKLRQYKSGTASAAQDAEQTQDKQDDKQDDKDSAKWIIDPEEVVTLKDAMLNGVESDIYSMNYERISKLYIKDFLEDSLLIQGK